MQTGKGAIAAAAARMGAAPDWGSEDESSGEELGKDAEGESEEYH